MYNTTSLYYVPIRVWYIGTNLREYNEITEQQMVFSLPAAVSFSWRARCEFRVYQFRTWFIRIRKEKKRKKCLMSNGEGRGSRIIFYTCLSSFFYTLRFARRGTQKSQNTRPLPLRLPFCGAIRIGILTLLALETDSYCLWLILIFLADWKI